MALVRNQVELSKYVLDRSQVTASVFDWISWGSFSTVHRGEFGSLPVAVKSVELNGSKELGDKCERELRICASLGSHPNIVQFYGYIKTKIACSMVFEYVGGGTADNWMEDKTTPYLPTQYDRVKAFSGLVKAVTYSHEKGFIVCDIKGANVLIHNQPSTPVKPSWEVILKLCDFGLSREPSELDPKKSGCWGTPTHMPPELLDETPGVNSSKTDCFSLAILLWEMIGKQSMDRYLDNFEIEKREELCLFYKDPDQIAISDDPVVCLPKVANIIKFCWCADPKKRKDVDYMDEEIDKVLADEKLISQMKPN